MMKHLKHLLLLITLVGSVNLSAEGNPTVVLVTDLGDITIELYPEKAPKTVENFLQYAKDGFYIGTIFHRVKPGFVVQGGGLTYEFVQKETREPVVNESVGGLRNTRGTVAMARKAEPDSATSQFFINMGNNKHLNAKKDKPGYTVFGRVVDGLKVAKAIEKEPQGAFRENAPNAPVRILDIKFLSESNSDS